MRKKGVFAKAPQADRASQEREISPEEWSGFIKGCTPEGCIRSFLDLTKVGKGGVILSDVPIAQVILRAVGKHVDTNFHEGQIGSVGSQFFISMMRDCPVSSFSWTGPKVDLLSSINLTGPSGAGKSTLLNLLHQKGVPIVDTDAVVRAIYNVASGRDLLDRSRLAPGWYKLCMQKLEEGNVRFASASRRARGLIDSLNLACTSVIGWSQQRALDNVPLSSIIINPLLNDSWEIYLLTCLGRAAADCIRYGTSMVHWLTLEGFEKSLANARTADRVLEIPVYAGGDENMISSVCDFIWVGLSQRYQAQTKSYDYVLPKSKGLRCTAGNYTSSWNYKELAPSLIPSKKNRNGSRSD